MNRIGLSIPNDVVPGSLQRLLELPLPISGGLIVVSLLLILLLARRIVRPSSGLTRLATGPATGCAGRSNKACGIAEAANALIESKAKRCAATVCSTPLSWTADLDEQPVAIGADSTMPAGTSGGYWRGKGDTMVLHPADSPAMKAAWAQNVDDCKMAKAASMRPKEGAELRVAEEAAAWEAAQARLNQAQRMQALGQLASGIAHDFNNVLQTIGGALFLIANQPNDAARVLRFAALAHDAAQRGAAITGRLLSLSRKEELRTGPIDSALVLSGIAEVLVHALGAKIAIRVEAAPGLPPLLADRGQLETVLINLATNARDAMHEGGVLTLSAALDLYPVSVGIDAGFVPRSGGYIRIEVADTGEGMEAAILARASELFFTTKQPGHGTGLGLAMASEFAEQSGGAFRIESAPGAGTTVRIWLPCATEAASAPPVRAETSLLPRLRGRVLLVDDDPLVRATLSEQLAELGLSVVSACDGFAGLRALGEDAGIGLLISDLAMAGMDGVALIQAAQRARPGLPAVLVTGHADSEMALELKWSIDGPFSVLQKPVSAVQLADRIGSLLEQHLDA